MAKDLVLDVLAVGAHADDIEITSGGLLIKLAARGHATGAVDLTRGEMGTYGSAEDRAAEAEAAAEMMGLTWRGNLGLSDAAVEYNQANKLKLAQVIRNTRPRLVILPHWEQRHPDHLAGSRLGYDACFLAGLQKIDLTGDPHRPHKILYASYFRDTSHSFLVDISDHMEQKCRVVAAYESQFGRPETSGRIFHPGTNIFDLMKVRAAALGQMVGVDYAEAYSIKENMLVDDPLDLAVRSV